MILIAMAGMAEAYASTELMLAWLGLLFVLGLETFAVVRGSFLIARVAAAGLILYSMLFAPWRLFTTLSVPDDPDVALWNAKFFTLAVFWIVMIVITGLTLTGLGFTTRFKRNCRVS